MWAVNALMFYLFSMLFPMNFELGNNIFTASQAALVSGLFLTLVSWLVDPLAKLLEWDMKSMPNMMFAYFLGNVVTIWFIARYSMLTGMGISDALWVFVLAVFTFGGQYIVASRGMKNKK